MSLPASLQHRRALGSATAWLLLCAGCELPSPDVGDARSSSKFHGEQAAPQPTTIEAERPLPPPPLGTSLAVETAVPTQPIPKALLAELSNTPYVEERCEPDPASPRARRCRYTALGLTAEVVVENPTPEEAARWFLDAAGSCQPLAAIRERDPASWARGVLAFAKHTRRQSSRIFPLRGEIVEDLGDGPHAFGFDRGVVSPCAKGTCRCRLNSLTVPALCRYREALGDDRATCLKALASDEAWRTQCVENHRRALQTGVNEHLRARAHLVGVEVQEKCDVWERVRKRPCSPGEVVMLVERELGLSK